MLFFVKILVMPTKSESELQCCLIMSPRYSEKLYFGQCTTPKYGAVLLGSLIGILSF